jgi:hypothetical protein
MTSYKKPCYIQYAYAVKYHMHPGGPVVDLSQFPTRMDYFDVNGSGGGATVAQQFGPTDGRQPQAGEITNWNDPNTLQLLQVGPPANTALGPTGATYPNFTPKNDIWMQSNWETIGQKKAAVPTGSGASWLPLVFDAGAKNPTVNLTIRFRPGMGIAGAPARPRQMIPLGLQQKDTLQASFSVDLLDDLNDVKSYYWQIDDPRLSWDVTQWQGPTAGLPPAPNGSNTDESIAVRSKFRYFERAPAGNNLANYAVDRPDEYDTASRVSSPGYWSLVHTGMQPNNSNGNSQTDAPWQTMNLGPDSNSGSTSTQASPPDWLLLDLLGATYPMVGDQFSINNSHLPDCYSTISYMNSTAGQVNLNSQIYPQNSWFQPPARILPLQAVFKNLFDTDSDLEQFLNNLNGYQTLHKFFGYVGELANVPGFVPATKLPGMGGTSTQWDQESLLRNMAGCLTTKSNTFGVWGVAQVVQKLKTNTTYGSFENGDSIVAEKRFYALVERYVWPGLDGVPGNGHVNNSSGFWDRLAVPANTNPGVTDTLFQLPGSPPLTSNQSSERMTLNTSGTYPWFDGPETVTMDQYSQAALGNVKYQQSTLENAYNPPEAVIKYRVVYFKYLDE